MKEGRTADQGPQTAFKDNLWIFLVETRLIAFLLKKSTIEIFKHDNNIIPQALASANGNGCCHIADHKLV